MGLPIFNISCCFMSKDIRDGIGQQLVNLRNVCKRITTVLFHSPRVVRSWALFIGRGELWTSVRLRYTSHQKVINW